MTSIIAILSIISIILSKPSTTSAASATCTFQNESTTSLSGTTFSYSCDLTIYNSGEVTQINGNHNSGHDNSDVKTLSIDNDQNLSKFSSIFCLKFNNLEAVKLSDCKLELIDSNSLQNCQNLKILKLDRNKISGLAENLLSRNTKLTFLQLNFNEIFSLPENLLQNQKQLELLDMSHNQINYLPDNIFKALINLKNLWIVGNKLTTLNPIWFRTLRNLEALYVDNNEIMDLPWGVFGPLTRLESLGLSSNLLKKVHSDWFSQHRSLKAIGLADNQITEVDERILDKTALDKLDMTENICNEDYIIVQNQIKEQMGRCFANYRPREAPKEAAGTFIALTGDCGKAQIGKGNIIGGTEATKGQFPWNIALVTPKGKFFCGGTVITSSFILTAAHCIHQKHLSELLPRDVIVLLGAYDLNNSIEIGRLSIGVKKIHMHRDWNPNIESYDADIAMLELETHVQFNSYIQPICLIEYESEASKLLSGVVVGYGKSEDDTKLHESIPKVIEVPIIEDNQNCFYKSISLVKISSNRTFCGGRGDGTGVCSGDSGVGLTVVHDDVYYLKGIVSASLFRGKSCDVNNYAVYTNVLKFNDWINEIAGK